jgi:predicted nucleotidyltransferase
MQGETRYNLIMNATEIEGRLREYFRESPGGAQAVYLFGSAARGDLREDSDVDIAILRPGGPPRRLEDLPIDLEGDIEDLLGLPVQIVLLDGAPVDLVHRILRDGILLLDRDPSARIRFEVTARNEFFDLEPILRRYREGKAKAR